MAPVDNDAEQQGLGRTEHPQVAFAAGQDVEQCSRRVEDAGQQELVDARGVDKEQRVQRSHCRDCGVAGQRLAVLVRLAGGGELQRIGGGQQIGNERQRRGEVEHEIQCFGGEQQQDE